MSVGFIAGGENSPGIVSLNSDVMKLNNELFVVELLMLLLLLLLKLTLILCVSLSPIQLTDDISVDSTLQLFILSKFSW